MNLTVVNAAFMLYAVVRIVRERDLLFPEFIKVIFSYLHFLSAFKITVNQDIYIYIYVYHICSFCFSTKMAFSFFFLNRSCCCIYF